MKQIKDKGAVFPFLESENGRKPLPWKKILTYEVSHSHVGGKIEWVVAPPQTFLVLPVRVSLSQLYHRTL